MSFINSIIEWLNNAAGFFYRIFLETYSWPWPFWYVSSFFYSLQGVCAGLAWAFYYFNSWVDYVAGKVAAILSTWDIWSYFKWWFDAAANAWNWVTNALYNVWNIVTSWWSSMQYTVLAWVQGAKDWATSLFNQANAWLAALQSAWDSFKSKLPSIDMVISWFKDWGGNVLAHIISWGALTGKQIDELIGSKFKEATPFWEGWQDFRDRVVEFFTNPLEFLFNRFIDWFLGPEK